MTTLRTRKDSREPAAPEAVQLVTFQLGTEEYGLAISAITEVIRPLRITPLPRMPRFIEGVINLRGTIIPVIDLRRRFGLTAALTDPRKARMLITCGAIPGEQGGRGLLGLAVDGVREVLKVLPADIDRAPEAATGSGADFIAGVAKMADQLVVVLDITKVLNREERAALAEAGDVHA